MRRFAARPSVGAARRTARRDEAAKLGVDGSAEKRRSESASVSFYFSFPGRRFVVRYLVAVLISVNGKYFVVPTPAGCRSRSP